MTTATSGRSATVATPIARNRGLPAEVVVADEVRCTLRSPGKTCPWFAKSDRPADRRPARPSPPRIDDLGKGGPLVGQVPGV